MMPPMNTRLLNTLPGHPIPKMKAPKPKKAAPVWHRLPKLFQKPSTPRSSAQIT